MQINKLFSIFFLILVIISMSIGCQEVKHNIDFQHEGDLYILPSDMHDTLHVKLEFADTDTEMMQGLMYRTSMKDNEGMLFIYPYSQEMNFWMKNTHIPLDLIYIDNAGEIVDLSEHAKPFSEQNIYSRVLSRFVLEVNGGFCEKNYIIVGDKIKWEKIAK
jgi:uncharacterized membrane protein (UPF0127 family)